MYTLGELAQIVNGTVIGDARAEISGAEVLSRAQSGHISFLRSDKFKRELLSCQATAFVVPTGFFVDRPCIQVNEPEHAFSLIVAMFRRPIESRFSGISSAANISPRAKLGVGVTVYPGAFIDDDVTIGDGTTIHANVSVMAGCEIGREVNIFPNVVLYPGTCIGDRCNIHAGAVLGAHGFGYESSSGNHVLSAQLGNVVIEDDCDIGACATIDRGTYGQTRIGAGTKIDNLVMVGHNCTIGRKNLIVSQSGIAGSCTTGEFVIMAGQTGVGDHVSIGARAILCAKSGVMNDLPGDQMYAGIPVTPAKEQFQRLAAQSRIPAMRKEIAALRKQLETISRVLESGQRKDNNVTGQWNNAADLVEDVLTHSPSHPDKTQAA
ncbi:MAG TPA: UDP-3-O-(3-hydroxymyristoyl)glucosamine N-acyltransferase [Pirellulaceae bacterium]|nr:UDP-3-O-(3-hydroxymyristoyl)glucosamine N-acyltransferase [Pirellulaceae bacterium]HMO90586.1 UDP-3-O-(3-hydroxymyristoyl)glucosamine N-acyltransferase [Pirellulaceae bacterium]HMP67835.1 UDP-3-O-(3-hydroxymyristoyl)glucosamine N-acyltransferase [Pirellulaceae bacterium]